MSDWGFGLAGGEQREARRERRLKAGGYMRINGRAFDLVDWSTSGFQAKRASGFGRNLTNNLVKGGRYAIEFNVDIDDDTYFFECACIVVRLSENGEDIAGVFLDMHDEDRIAVVQYFEDQPKIAP
ncbi:MAG: hypothetical protein R3245_09285 [Kiloniellales bacterium]|nr:hypothetical protein [Kiloniellales bacterium]